jgi:hypothetical protein
VEGETVTGALDLMRQVAAAGGRLRVVGDGSLQVSAPTPLPDALVENLRAHKGALLAALAPGVPAEWAAGVASLQTMTCPAIVRPDRWREAVSLTPAGSSITGAARHRRWAGRRSTSSARTRRIHSSASTALD